MSDVHWLGHEDCHHTHVVGGKAASLSRLASLHTVPPGFAIPALDANANAEGLPQAAVASIRAAYARLAEQQHALSSQYQVFDHPDRAVNGPANSECEADYVASAVADGGDTMQRPFDARPVISPELADTLDGIVNVLLGYLPRVQDDALVEKPGFGVSPHVKDHLQQFIDIRALP